MRADLLMAAADAGAVDAYRQALAVVDEPADRSRLRARLAARLLSLVISTLRRRLWRGCRHTVHSPTPICFLRKECSPCSGATSMLLTPRRPKRAKGSCSADPMTGRCST
jgi:hypothetical protein